tara:strand:- start:2717 stop:3019 length:303 start_codon:yes stop_codon:yes gene_type:complete
MKITKTRLKELIKEELERLDEGEALGTGAGRKATRAQALAVGRSDISGIERSAIVKLQQQLLDAAKTTNIVTGPVASLMKRLSAALDKLGVSTSPEAEVE